MNNQARPNVRLEAAARANEILADPCASFWLKNALQSAMRRDPVDASNDAHVLAELLHQHCNEVYAKVAAMLERGR